MNDLEKPMRLGGATIGEHRHVCAFFRNADEEYEVMLPFIKEGLERGEKAFHVVNLQLHKEHLRRLVSAGIDAPAAEKTGQFELRNWHETYLRDGRFDEGDMLAFIPEVLERAPAGVFADSFHRTCGLDLAGLAGHHRFSKIRDQAEPHCAQQKWGCDRLPL